jgi:hypothetical protein
MGMVNQITINKWEETGLLAGLSESKKASTANVLEDVGMFFISQDDALQRDQSAFFNTVFPVARRISERKPEVDGKELAITYKEWLSSNLPLCEQGTCFGTDLTLDSEKRLVDKFVSDYFSV